MDAYLPGALVADRTAMENRPASDGSVFLIAYHKRDISLPGITLRPQKGQPALDTDRPFVGSLRLAYFFNLIEGTEFAVDEAEDIIFKGRIPKARPARADCGLLVALCGQYLC